MLSSLLSPTRIYSFETIAPRDFAAAAFYLGRGPRKVAVVVDGRALDGRDALVEALRGRFDTVLLDRVSPDPLASDIDAMLESGALEGAALVIGIGGGSVLDSAKALSALAPLAAAGGAKPRLEDYLGPSPARKIEAKGVPLLLVPTTAGTGAEVTKVGVYRDGTGRKHTLGSPFLQADAALLVGSLAASMPPALAASTGFDALSHALESLWNKNATELTIEAAVEAAAAALDRLPRSYAAPNPAASLAMLEASAMAGFAFSITGTAMGHALSFVLSEEWRVPHGAACAFTLEDCFRWAMRDMEVRGRLARVAEAAGEGASPERLLDRILRMKETMRLPSSFRDLGVAAPKGELRSLFARAFDDPKMANMKPAAEAEAVYSFLEAKA